MSFIGLVTRKDKDTGATLVAKIVTASKKKAAYKAFKVKVKANGLDDYACCVIDHAEIRKYLDLSQSLESIADDLDFRYNGANGTTISYEIHDVNGGHLSDYMDENGNITSYPKFTGSSDNDAFGAITIIVRKNNAEVRSTISVAIRQITPESIFEQEDFTALGFWNNHMKGTNDIWDGSNQGPQVKENLLAPESIDVSKYSDVPIKVEYSIEDLLGKENIVNASNPTCPITSPTTKQTYNLPLSFADEDGKPIKCRLEKDPVRQCYIIKKLSAVSCAYLNYMSQSNNNYPLISSYNCSTSKLTTILAFTGGIKVTVTLSLGEAHKTLTYYPYVRSRHMTWEEMKNWVAIPCLGYKLYSSDSNFKPFNEQVQTVNKTTESGLENIYLMSGGIINEPSQYELPAIVRILISQNAQRKYLSNAISYTYEFSDPQTESIPGYVDKSGIGEGNNSNAGLYDVAVVDFNSPFMENFAQCIMKCTTEVYGLPGEQDDNDFGVSPSNSIKGVTLQFNAGSPNIE